MSPAVVPELEVFDLSRSLAFYVDVLGFKIFAERPEEGFAYLTLGAAHLMLEAAGAAGRKFTTAPLEPPFGRGINLQIEVDDVVSLWAAVQKAESSIVIELEERWYRQGAMERGHRQFVVSDPDGYILRPFTSLGSRPAERTKAL